MNRIRILASHAVVAALGLAATLIMLPGCTRVGERVTGVEMEWSLPTDCVRDCNREFLRDLAAETRKLLSAWEACKQLPQADRPACFDAAWAAYEAAVAALNDEREACVGGCHRQGTGTAG